MKHSIKRMLLATILCTVFLAGCDSANAPIASSVTPPHSAAPDVSPLSSVNISRPAHLYLSLNGIISPNGETDPSSRVLLQVGGGYFLNGKQGDFSEVRTAEGEGGWIPAWYLNEESAQIRNLEPQELTMKLDTDALWYPNGQETAVSLKAGELVYAYQEFEDWYGVIASSKNDASHSPFMLWIPKANAEVSGPAPSWFGIDAVEEEAMRVLATAVSSLVVPGISQARVRELFGEPAYTEQSSNKGETGDKPFTLPVWRYETRTAHLILEWNAADVLESAYYQDADGLLNLDQWTGSIGREPYLAPSIVPDWEWRFQSDLPYNFLIDSAGDALIIAGEDGGFSGMHMKSILYALHKGTGEKIWQYDFGPHATMYGMSKDKRRLSLLKQDTDRKSVTIPYVLETLYTQTGELAWQHKMDDVHVQGLTVSGNSAVVLYSNLSNGTVTDDYSVQAWDVRTGQSLWTSKLPGYKDISIAGDQELVVLQAYREGYDPEGGVIIGLDPATGQEQWKLEKRHISMYNLLEDPSGYTAGSGKIWTSTTDRLWLTDVRTGTDLEQYPIQQDSWYEVVNDQYLLSVRTDRTDDDRTFTSSFIDRKTGEKRFTEQGYASYGTIVGNKLYFRLHNHASSFDLTTNKKIGFEYEGSYIDAGPVIAHGKILVSAYPASGTVYVLDPDTMDPLGRLLDTKLGVYDITPTYFMQGYLTDISGSLYIGSANGWFSKLKPIELQPSP